MRPQLWRVKRREGGSQRWGGSALLQLRQTDQTEADDSRRRLGTDTVEAESSGGLSGVPAGHGLGELMQDGEAHGRGGQRGGGLRPEVRWLTVPRSRGRQRPRRRLGVEQARWLRRGRLDEAVQRLIMWRIIRRAGPGQLEAEMAKRGRSDQKRVGSDGVTEASSWRFSRDKQNTDPRPAWNGTAEAEGLESGLRSRRGGYGGGGATAVRSGSALVNPQRQLEAVETAHSRRDPSLKGITDAVVAEVDGYMEQGPGGSQGSPSGGSM